ncbi:MAG: cell wall anchor protein [Muribaculaceae bacterium]|nr:cell wall anchor protein [Muribaculaceae bacterium]
MFGKKLTASLILSIAAATAGSQALAAPAAKVKASIDSAQMLMGNVTAVRFDIVDRADAQSRLVVDKAAMPPEVEPLDWVEGDTTDLGNGLVEIKRSLLVQSFDSGVYTIPPFLLISGPDTARTNPLTLKVLPVDVSKLDDIHPLAPVAGFESRWYDILPDWLTDYWLWILLGAVIVAGGICAYLILTKKVAVSILPQKKRLPPYEIAMQKMQALREAQLCEHGQEKEFYTALIDILREYLQYRFGINAMEMTSSQIVKALSKNADTRMPGEYMKKVVEIADFVKFAKVRPLPDDNARSFNNAMRFIEETRPEPEPDASEGDAAKASGYKESANTESVKE